jgi:hypothetical protein
MTCSSAWLLGSRAFDNPHKIVRSQALPTSIVRVHYDKIEIISYDVTGVILYRAQIP